MKKDTPNASLSEKIRAELNALGLATLYFAVWIGGLVLLKKLILAEYQVEFKGLSAALVGALILAKVVLILEHVPLGRWIRLQPAWVDLLLRTTLYTCGVCAVMLLEKGFEGRHAHGSVSAALSAQFDQVNLYHLLANTLCVAGALLSFNALALIRDHLGPEGLKRVFMLPKAESQGASA